MGKFIFLQISNFKWDLDLNLNLERLGFGFESKSKKKYGGCKYVGAVTASSSALLQTGLWNLTSTIYPITSTSLGSTIKIAVE